MPPAPSPRLFLVDGYALIYRAFFAYGAQPLINSKGENTSIARGAHDFLKRLIDKHKPEYLGWVHDAGLSFRHERYPAYKATRERLEPEMQADFDTGVERITQILEAFKIPVLSLEGYEADDVIGTLAKQAAAKDVNAVIVSGDKDFVQLVDEGHLDPQPVARPSGIHDGEMVRPRERVRTARCSARIASSTISPCSATPRTTFRA